MSPGFFVLEGCRAGVPLSHTQGLGHWDRRLFTTENGAGTTRCR
jgi:hypothetical protein